MIGRRAIVGLSLLCALFFSALAAQSASATETAKNTTAFTCIGKSNGGFSDAHCDTVASPGSFGHEVIAVGIETELREITNEKTKTKTLESTPVSLKGILGGAELEVTCKRVSTAEKGKSFIRNIEPSAQVHDFEGTVDLELSECSVAKPSNCTLISMTFLAIFKGVENVGAINRMGIQFTQDEEGGKKLPLAKFQLEGAFCPLKAAAVEVTGSAIATGGVTPNEPATKQAGATLVFTGDAEHESLVIGGKIATFTGTLTTKMSLAGNPISLTTVT